MELTDSTMIDFQCERLQRRVSEDGRLDKDCFRHSGDTIWKKFYDITVDQD